MFENVYYIGFRESDINNVQFIKGSITKYGTSINTNTSFTKYRLNPFKSSKEIHDFFEEEMHKIIYNDPNCKFLFSNQKDAYNYDNDVFIHSIAFNSINSINIFSDKFFCRQYFQKENYCPLSYILHKEQITSQTLSFLFPQTTSVVVQDRTGAGGNSTHIIKNINDISKEIKNFSSEYFLVSNYINNCTSFNVHILLSQDNIIVFPPSQQIIKKGCLFYGSNFNSMSAIPTSLKQEIKASALRIGNMIKKLGCRGIVGIDFISDGNKLYFIEINFRFQGSSLLLNKYLLSNGYKSLYEYHVESFQKSIELSNDLFFKTIPYSNYIVFNKNDDELYKYTGDETILDGYYHEMPMEDNAYLYTIIHKYHHDVQ